MLIVLAVIAAVILLILSTPVGIHLKWADEKFVKLKIGPLKFQVWPMKKKEKKPKTETENETEKKSKKQKLKKKYSAEAIKQFILSVIPPIKRAVSAMGAALRFDLVKFGLVIGGDNPAKIAERYGKANAVVWTIVPLIENAAHIKRREIRVDFDYSARSSSVSGEIIVHIRIWAGVSMLFIAGIPVIKALLKFVKSGKTEDADKKADSKPTETAA